MPLRSELKVRILVALLEGPKNLSELKTKLNIRETTILHVLKEFEHLDLTNKTHGTYGLTSIGLVEAKIYEQCIDVSAVIENFKEFWLTHNVTSIPDHLLLRIGELKESTLVKAKSSELQAVHETFMQVLLSSKTIKGISPIFHPDYVSAFRHLLSQGNLVDLIITTDVLNKTLKSADAKLLQEFLAAEKLKIFIKDDLKIALTITENSFSLGLFNLSGEYDYSMDLISLSPKAISWGEELFKILISESKRLSP
jgi:predicted transcriptional regulator